MAVCFWYLVKPDLYSVHYRTGAYTSVTFYKVPEKHGYIYLVEFTNFKKYHSIVVSMYLIYVSCKMPIYAGCTTSLSMGEFLVR